TVTVAFSTADGTAHAPGDYAGTSQTVVFAPGQTGQTVLVPVVDDTLPEANETVHLSLPSPSGANLGTPSAPTLTILADEPPPVLSFSQAVYQVNEGVGSAVITAVLSQPSGQAVLAHYASANGSATAPADYAAVSGTLSFAPGQTSRTFTVPIVADAVPEWT